MAFVTGTSSGIGTALAMELIERGWEVVGVSRRPAPFLHARYTHMTFDLADLDVAIEGIQAYFDDRLPDPRWQRIGLVNNAADGSSMGPIENLIPDELRQVYTINTVAPTWLMGYFVRRCQSRTTLRIVNVSSGAAVRPFPGLATYGGSKAALRMAGMCFAAELESPLRSGGPRGDVTILSYEPGTVDTAMQVRARSTSDQDFPWVGLFRTLHSQGALRSPKDPAIEIANYLERDGHDRFTERRLGA